MLKWSAYALLVAAYLYGFMHRNVNLQNLVQGFFGEKYTLVEIESNPLIYRIDRKDENIGSYLSVTKGNGWGGPFYIAVEISNEGKINDIHVLGHKETPLYLERLKKNKFFTQFVNKKITDPMVTGNGIDTVSGATVSSKAFIDSIRKSSYNVARNVMNIDVRDKTVKWEFGYKDVILISLLILIIFGSLKKVSWLRYVTMIIGLAVLGFYLNSPLSLSQISSLLLGFYPSLKQNLFWWILIIGIVLITIIFGRNLYCYWLCPFGTLQELLNKITGFKVKINPKILKAGKYVTYFIAWLSLMMIFLSSDPSIATYIMPFSTIFGFEAYTFQWYLLPAILIISLFIKRFWCRFLCPVGAMINQTARIKRLFKRIIPRADTGEQS